MMYFEKKKKKKKTRKDKKGLKNLVGARGQIRKESGRRECWGKLRRLSP